MHIGTIMRMKKYTLHEKTLDLLRSDKRGVDEISQKSDINKHWLGKFRQGRFKNPGVNTVEKLFHFLSKRNMKP